MNNDSYFAELEQKIAEMNELRKKCPVLATGMIGQSLLKEDLFFCASLNRSVQLSEGFITLLQQRNLSCVGAILRLLLDNCMRTYAAFIAKNKDDVIDCVIHGEKISDQLDIDGHKMTDCYLKKKMKAFNKSFPDVYNQASGYIHFSDMAFYETIVDIDNQTISLQIGQPLHERFNTLLIEAADAFIHFTKLLHKMLQAVVDSKQRFDLEHKND